MISNVKHFLSAHPLFGAGTSIGGSVMQWMEYINPLIRTTGLFVGLTIGIITLIIKIKELRGK
tara:strand:- start:573 stop:761 length:189 start_codon:yes stop_codon:yes gene_type:complete